MHSMWLTKYSQVMRLNSNSYSPDSQAEELQKSTWILVSRNKCEGVWSHLSLSRTSNHSLKAALQKYGTGMKHSASLVYTKWAISMIRGYHRLKYYMNANKLINPANQEAIN